jgi:pSer/pThr/pTyr-binding forkhead associated (FHA) protein
MAKQTQNISSTFSGTVGTGVSALLGKGKTYYILEHKDDSKYHRQGESQAIIVDHAELGRDAACQVRFDEATFPTVSRRHAAILRDGQGQWNLINLSAVNATYVNGNKVVQDWHLKSGDEIQLSSKGPRMNFIIPTGEPKAGALPVSERFTAFVHQSLRPYRNWLIAIAVVLLLAIIGGIIWASLSESRRQKEAAETHSTLQLIADDIKGSNARFVSAIDSLSESNKEVKDAVGHFHNSDIFSERVGESILDNETIKSFSKYIYYIKVTEVEVFDKNQKIPQPILVTKNPRQYYDVTKALNLSWAGTGFLLDDGRLVTARHVVEPWTNIQYIQESDPLAWLTANYLINNQGVRIVVHFRAISAGDKEVLEFTNEDMKISNRYDKNILDITLEGSPDPRVKQLMSSIKIKNIDKIIACTRLGEDWAYLPTNRKGGLKLDKDASGNLQVGVPVFTLGFPQEFGALDKLNSLDITPIPSDAIVGEAGLTKREETYGCSVLTNAHFEAGNSGGPVIYYDKDKQPKVVGIVSAMGKHIGFMVPASAIIDNL